MNWCIYVTFFCVRSVIESRCCYCWCCLSEM